MKKPRLQNTSIKYFEGKIEREKEIEKICREICQTVYNIDPDNLICQMQPQVIGNLDKYNVAWIVPEKQYQRPAWELFKEEVQIVWHHIALNGAPWKK
jgi:hypothetical protein